MSENDSDSDYQVEEHIIPDRIAKRPINDESADILGNFDDTKRKEIEDGQFLEGPGGKYDNHVNSSDDDDEEEVKDYTDDESNNVDVEMKTNIDEDINDEDDEDDDESQEINTKLTTDQVNSLLRGASKSNRFVLYVTNLNFETNQRELENYFSQAGDVKGVRIPKKRRGGFAFVEMSTIEGFQKGFELHNTELKGRIIKIQISEGGKKKSANKKNILKQKNRKLAEMRNEDKEFTKSGKNYDKSIKKEKEKEFAARKRWRKPKPKQMS